MTTSVNDHTFSTCENILEARNGIRLLNLVCLVCFFVQNNKLYLNYWYYQQHWWYFISDLQFMR